MSKYIDADLYVEMQIYDDEHEEWGIWNGTIEELLDHWTEQGCPTPIEVSEDCISKANAISELSLYRKTVEVSITPRVSAVASVVLDIIDDCIKFVENVPSVAPICQKNRQVERAEGEWIDENGNHVPFDNDGNPSRSCWCKECGEWLVGSDEYPVKGNYCPNCGAKMKG